MRLATAIGLQESTVSTTHRLVSVKAIDPAGKRHQTRALTPKALDYSASSAAKDMPPKQYVALLARSV